MSHPAVTKTLFTLHFQMFSGKEIFLGISSLQIAEKFRRYLRLVESWYTLIPEIIPFISWGPNWGPPPPQDLPLGSSHQNIKQTLFHPTHSDVHTAQYLGT